MQRRSWEWPAPDWPPVAAAWRPSCRHRWPPAPAKEVLPARAVVWPPGPAPPPFDDRGAGRTAGECGGVSTGAARATAALAAGEPSAPADAVRACGRAG